MPKTNSVKNEKRSYRKPKTLNQIGEMYINSSEDVQRHFCSFLNTYQKENNITTKLSQQWRETGMYEPLANVRLSVLNAAKSVYGFEFHVKLAGGTIITPSLPLKPQPLETV